MLLFFFADRVLTENRGAINSFGVFQSYYKETLLPNHSASSISWIGTTQGFLLFVVGIFAGPIFDLGYMRTLISVGTFLVVFGLMMVSISTQYYQVFLAHGVVVGIGCGCIYLPSIAIVATYFTSRRALATGITAAGGSIGKCSPPTPCIFNDSKRSQVFVVHLHVVYPLSPCKAAC